MNRSKDSSHNINLDQTDFQTTVQEYKKKSKVSVAFCNSQAKKVGWKIVVLTFSCLI